MGRRRLNVGERFRPNDDPAQRPNEGDAVGIALRRILRQSSGDNGPIAFPQRTQIRFFAHVLERQLPDRSTSERALAGQQLHIDDRKTVLVAMFGDLARKRFRSGIHRRHAAHQARRALPFQALYQPEVGDFDVVADQKQVTRLDVEMQQVVALDEIIEPVGRIRQITQQHVAGNAESARFLIAPQGNRGGSSRRAP